MEIVQGVWKQHLRPHALVGYVVKIFLPSPPNYVTRSPGGKDDKKWPGHGNEVKDSFQNSDLYNSTIFLIKVQENTCLKKRMRLFENLFGKPRSIAANVFVMAFMTSPAFSPCIDHSVIVDAVIIFRLSVWFLRVIDVPIYFVPCSVVSSVFSVYGCFPMLLSMTFEMLSHPLPFVFLLSSSVFQLLFHFRLAHSFQPISFKLYGKLHVTIIL